MKIVAFNITNALGFREGILKTGDHADRVLFSDKFNLIIGKNDSGKSNVAKSLLIILISLNKWIKNVQGNPNPPQHDRSVNVGGQLLHYGDFKYFKLDSFFLNYETENQIKFDISIEVEQREIPSVVGDDPATLGKLTVSISGFIRKDSDDRYIFDVSGIEIKNTSQALLFSTADFNDSQIWRRLRQLVNTLEEKILSVVYVPHNREIHRSEYSNLIGKEGDLLKKLHDLKEGSAEDYEKFLVYQEFVLKLINQNQEKERRIVFPVIDSKTEIGISNDMDVFDLSNYGSGVEQLAILAAYVVLYSKSQLVILEEPETHFHPDLQRAFFTFLTEVNKRGFQNQYIIISHSSVFINEVINVGGKIFRSEKTDPRTNQTVLNEVSNETVFELIDELGVKGSDLYQSNGIIWVEGPSDRIYIKKWLELYCSRHTEKNLPKENIDYSFAYYGGSILNHFTSERPNSVDVNEERSDFIELLKINKHVAVVVDRDTNSSSQKNQTKRRIESELNGITGSFFWKTQGYEVENYLTTSVIQRYTPAFNQLIADYEPVMQKAFDKCFDKGASMNSAFKNKQKVPFAKIVLESSVYEDFFITETDLEEKISQLYSTIQNWIT